MKVVGVEREIDLTASDHAEAEAGLYVGGPVGIKGTWERAFVPCPYCRGRLSREAKTSRRHTTGRIIAPIGPRRGDSQPTVIDPLPRRTHLVLSCGRCRVMFTTTHARLREYYKERRAKGLPTP